ncbi:CpsD/CapB family tyrosine-protein kinase [Alkalihalobacillus sp. MEB130]|uniref:CpsD/CapB family tyrosine-protein kinase n=1 Tax=Alkalihalobacillus sp. MEB130 TaxID=2976704 RepID=UPI0028DE4229|nr:CpsD/CapB family tyrosine-protein kinase [Alkalihalobacillus sp. MEB130]MDT8861112.1 CpsD/CapB family tyrosine-protein kinase [Alkalihalobacillus sp. MEB130]
MLLKMKKKKFITINKHPESLINDEYESIKTNLEFTAMENHCRTLVITSPNYGEGKSITTANLAISLAHDGKKVLIIDTNVRRPFINAIFKIKNNIGLTNILIGQKLLEEAINHTEVPLVNVVTSGPLPLDTERLFKSTLMDKVLEQSRELFDYVLIDTPAVLEESDTKIIASRCDGVIMVVRNGQTEDESALEAKNMLDISNAKLLGVIFNAKAKSVL